MMMLTSEATEPYTYWVDSSCPQAGVAFDKAFLDARSWLRSASEKLARKERLQMEYFGRLFSPPGDPRSPEYREVYNQSKAIIGGRNTGAGAAPSRPSPAPIAPSPLPTSRFGLLNIERTASRTGSNYRFYCDNDAQDLTGSGTGRWKLRRDIDEPRPDGYQLQRDRPSFRDVAPNEAWQEFEDQFNRLLFGATSGCHGLETKAQTYTEPMPGDLAGQNPLRATVTICDKQLKADPRLDSLDDIPANFDFMREFGEIPQGSMQRPLDYFGSLTSFTLLHEA
ncbi:MAG: hypothetical protein Q9227_004536 [Pyrenula ochraceoflavens]